MHQTEKAFRAIARGGLGQIRTRGIGLLLILICMTVIVSACGKQANTNVKQAEETPASTASNEGAQTQFIKHGFGETEVPLHPKRVAVFGLEDIMLSLEAPMVYAYGFKGYYLEEQLNKLNIKLSNNTNFEPSYEQILASQPDLIIVQQYSIDQSRYEELSKIAPTIAFAPDDWRSSIVVIGKALGLEDKAQAVLKAHDEKIEQAKKAVTDAVGTDKTVVYMRPSEKDLQVFFPSFSFVYTAFGLNPDASIAEFQKETSDDWGINTSLEKLPTITADYIFAIYGGSIDTEEEVQKQLDSSAALEKLQVWKAIPAVKENHVFKVSPRHWMSSGPIAESKQMEDVVAAVTGKK
ncbi:ABC transporter substrate-binding protein [Paenibacillus radicis (ex Gao et al. 2016)]|uniref:ABC transporter substrate-binding lipoprotein YhfQ n=1 Tax=Paenibacillus radicis (ex Gao et al. 2016) TaxID=1737354 RepID=A0A917GQK2_9BACL|nr:ABC transporter substrate-binding protein [Paenibacillus radicis (ex Gao et al. 2016)]GGG53894.1 putative ABC transporter substrate-binding lipoprotein YhfQ [Paenibacillus radicis (ex Gao et al. 2016)]